MTPCSNICHEYICVEMFYLVFFVKTSFMKLFVNYISIVVMFFSISQKYGCDYCSTSIHSSFWYANVLCEHDDKGTYGQFCLYDWMMCHVTMIEHVQFLLHLYPFLFHIFHYLKIMCLGPWCCIFEHMFYVY